MASHRSSSGGWGQHQDGRSQGVVAAPFRSHDDRDCHRGSSGLCDSVVVVGGRVGALLSIADRRSGVGPLGGIEALLASGIDTEYLICPSDIPLITPELLRRLTVPSESTATIFEIRGDKRVESLPLRISAAALDPVTLALDAGQNAINIVIGRIDVDRVTITAKDANALRNINTPGDYAALSRFWETTRRVTDEQNG